MFLFLCNFSIAFWGCLDLFYFHLRFIKNFQIIWEEFPLFSQFFTICLYLRGIGYSTEPGRQAHTGSGGLRYAAKILYEIMLAGFLCLTKPAFMRRPWRITPCPAVHGWAFLYFVGIISTVSRQLCYSPSRACVCLPPGFLTLWLYLPSCRFAHGYCRRLALCMFAILLRFPLGYCRGLALCVLVILLRFPLGCCLGLALCVLVICVCFARSPLGSLGFARSPRGFAQT